MDKILILSSLLLLIFVASCHTQNNITERGVLEGKISIGPICPVERIPPDPGCQPTEETFKAYQIAVWDLNKERITAKLNPDLSGNFKVELSPSKYVVDFENRQSGWRQGRSLPRNVLIETGKTTNLDIDIDTGIR